jgi:hypothetical protein
MKQGAYVQYPNAVRTDLTMEDVQKGVMRLKPELNGSPTKWFTNLFFWKSDAEIDAGWVRTVVNPSETGSRMASLVFWFHLLVWVVAIALTSIQNFGIQSKAWSRGGSTPGGDWASGTREIALYTGLAGVFAVVGILVSSAFYDLEAYKKSTGTNTAITFLMNYSLVGSFFLFAKEASWNDNSTLFYIGLFGVLAHAYAVVLFYSCSAALDTLALPRAFIPTLAISVQTINYMEINDGNFHCRYAEATADAVTTDSNIDAPVDCTDQQKFLALLVPVLTVVAVALMIFGRKMLRDASEGGSQMKDSPVVRSVILLLFLASGILSIYKYAYLAGNITDNVARMYAMFGLLLQFAIIAIVFVPTAKPTANSKQVSDMTGQPTADVGASLESRVDIGV